LISPFEFIELIQPMGRGPTMAVYGSSGKPWFFFRGS
jgi:hypothetical protein